MKTNITDDKILKTLLRIDDKLSDLVNVIFDINMKLCYLIKKKVDYQDILEGNDYLK